MNSRILTLIAVTAILVLPAFAGKPKPPENPAKVVDKGSFAVRLGGKRVATEEFTISQTDQGSTAQSELKLEDGKPAQSCKWQMTPDGSLQRYEWHVLGGQDKSAVVVEPENEFLIEHVTLPDLKTADHHYLLTPSTAIADDYFFSQREILLWRYLAGNCKSEAGKPGCSLAAAQYGIITPRQNLSSLISLEYVGRDRIDYKGAQAEMSHFKISSNEGAEWHLWLDDTNKLVRIWIPTENTEVVRE